MVLALEVFQREPFAREHSAALYHRTLWLGTMRALALGTPAPPLKNLQAATITINKERIAIRSICLGS
jgi:hypothetical protein